MSWTIDDEVAWSRDNAFRQYLGIRVEQLDQTHAGISLLITESLLQVYGVVHGGVYCMLIDTAIGAAVRGSYQCDIKPMTTDLNISFLRPTGLGRIYADAGLIKAGRTVAVGTCEVRDEHDRKLAVGRGSFLVRQDRPANGDKGERYIVGVEE